MLVDVLRVLFVIGGDLAHFAQYETSGLAVAHDMASLTVGLRASGDLDHERGSGILEILRQCARRTSTEIIGVRDEQIREPVLLQLVEETGLPDGGIQVAMTWRAPFEVGVLRERHRFTGRQVDLRFHMLHDFHRNVLLVEFAVMMQHPHRVLGGTEGVHQSKRQFDTQTGACGKHLSEDDVDEAHLLRLVATHRKQRLRAIKSHRRAEASVELEERSLGERADGLVVVDGLVDVVETRHIGKRFDIVLMNPRGSLVVAPHGVQMPELADGHLAHAVFAHLRGGLIEYV